MTQSTPQPLTFTQRQGYRIYQAGKHFSGTFIRVYIPDDATQPGQPLRTITYLHGFALCMPSFYESHLEMLAQQGYIIFFPDFQRSCYPNTLPSAIAPKRSRNLPHLRHWSSVAFGMSGEGDRPLSIEDTPTLESICEKGTLGTGFSPPSVKDARSVGRSLSIIILILKVWSWFQREYGKNLIHLLSTVGISLFHEATESLTSAIALTQNTWDDLCETFPHWHGAEIESFAFGHSLGGLIALSLPAGYENTADQRFFPHKIVVADPAASTEMGIPWFAIALLKLFHSPFTQAPIRITQTGQQLKIPVVILHGGADKLVKPKTWRQGALDSPNFEAIASLEKQVYFSYSNPKDDLVAFHNQAVTSTQYYDDGLFEHFGGVKTAPNAYNSQYIWPGLDLIYSGQATPSNLKSHLNPQDFEIELEPPAPKKSVWAWLIGTFLLLSATYWLAIIQ